MFDAPVPLWAVLGFLVISYCLGFLTPLGLAFALIRKAVRGR